MPFEIRIDRYFTASHQLRLPDGTLEARHAHGWAVSVTVGSDTLDAMDCVMDFHKLERQVSVIVGTWDRTHLNEVSPFKESINPSAERVAEVVGQRLNLPKGVRLVKVDVGEATGCTATYRP
jgi:6-pyruvoyl-tetrahydropterin synthase